jgi:antitoxin component YwqK of YwqJK toxin-antitoxin module
MRFRLPLFPLLFVLLLLAATSSDPASADYEAGLKAASQRDYQTARAEFLASAEQGDPQAQYALGMLHHQGKGVEQDERAALEWFRKARDNGHPKAAEMVDLVTSRLPNVPAEPDVSEPAPDSAGAVARDVAAPDALPVFDPSAPLPHALLHPQSAPEELRPEACLARLQASPEGCQAYSEIDKEYGKRDIVTYRLNGVPFSGTACDLDEAGRLRLVVEVKEGRKNGRELRYDRSKGYLRSVLEYRDGLCEGWAEFYPDGTANSLKQFTAGLPNGSNYSWYEGGEPFIWQTFREGKEHGFFVSFYRSGGVEDLFEYKMGKRDGKLRSYFEDGKLRASQDLKDGKCVTPLLTYDAAGEVIKEKECPHR